MGTWDGTGEIVGVAVGSDVGCAVGACVGAGVGSDDGSEVGFAVGAAVTVGDGLGNGVGAPVGREMSQSTAPGASVVVPSGHGSHARAASVGAYRPTGQSEQLRAPGPELEPGLHDAHGCWPRSAAYSPASHA